MAVYCPIYDPVRGWYIIVCGPKGSYKQYISSPLYYYHTMGVKPPVGAKFTEEDYLDLDIELEEADQMSSSSPSLASSSLPPPIPISSSTAPLFTNSLQTAATSMSQFNHLSNSINPPLYYVDSHFNSSSSDSSSPKIMSNSNASKLKKTMIMNKKLEMLETALEVYGEEFNSPLLSTSPFSSSLTHSSSIKAPHFAAPVATNSFSVNDYPMSPADYNDSTSYKIFDGALDESAMKEDNFDI
ncbi:uncharacterized protein LOC131668922 [Phymastichus coffea]|uniref:uncharacterized protein LOC131668922 n=1 Tax=Phymastichus coffea TaxID=108790 RepID=UPI00273C385E|nr:uncharacterized protein LOC131668922 [Phymastichus coffea]